MLAKRSHVRFEFTNTKKLSRIEASSFCCQQFANLFADCFSAFHTYQLEFANTNLPTLVCHVKAALLYRGILVERYRWIIRSVVDILPGDALKYKQQLFVITLNKSGRKKHCDGN